MLGGSVQEARAAEEMKDEVQQFAELRGQVEKKGRDEVVRKSRSGSVPCCPMSFRVKDYGGMYIMPVVNTKAYRCTTT